MENSTALGNAVNQFSEPFGAHKDALAKAFRAWVQSDEFVDKSRKHLGQDLALGEAVESFSKASQMTESPVEGVSLDELVSGFLFELGIQLEVVDPVLKLKAEKARHQQVLDRLNDIERRTEVGNNQVLARLDDLSPPKTLSYEVHEAEQRLPEEVAFHGRIDVALDHLNHGKAKLAKDSLMQLRVDLGRGTHSLYLKSRLANALGACYMKLELLSEVRDEFQEALNLKRSRLNLSNLAAAKLNLSDNKGGLDLSRQAVSFSPSNSRTVAIHIQALHLNGLESEVFEFSKEHSALLESDSNCLLALGQLQYDQGNFSVAEDYFEKAGSGAPYDPQFKLLRANCILKSIENPFQDMTPLDGMLSAEIIDRVSQAEKLAQEAVELLAKDDFTINKIRALEYHASAEFLLKDYPGAEKDCLAILDLDSGNQLALLKMGFLALTLRNDDLEAISYFEKVQSNFLAPMAVVAAGAYINTNDLEKAKACLAAVEQEATKRKLWYVFAREKLRIAEIEHKVDEEISELLAVYSGNGDVFYAVAEIYKERGDTKKALEFFDKASTASDCTLQLFIPRMKAQTYFDASLFEAAYNVYASMPNIREFKRDWYEYICAMGNIRDQSLLGSAGSEAKQAREANGGELIPAVSEIEAAARLIKLNDPRGALQLMIQIYQNQRCSPQLPYLIQQANAQIARRPMDLSDPYQ